MEPTPTPPPDAPDPTAGQPVVEFVRTKRPTAAYALLGLSVLLLGLTIWLAARGFKPAAGGAEDAATEKDAKDKAGKLAGRDLATGAVPDPNKVDYAIGAFAAGLGFLTAAGVGAWLLVTPPRPTVAAQRTEARVQLLTFGTVAGLILMLLGVALFYRWSDSLLAWLNQHETKQARWVLIPLLIVVAGAGAVFLAVQPARAEERNNPWLRRLVYGSNFALTTLLMFIALVVVNVLLGLKLPNRLDTTSSGFYTLSDSTRKFIADLDQTVTAYAILAGDGDPVTNDIRQLLQSCQDANPARFRVRFLSPALNAKDVAELRREYPQAELSREGVLFVAGDPDDKSGPKRHTFLREDEFTETVEGTQAASKRSFNGEKVIARELRFLADNKTKPVVYFTQHAGELSLSGREADGRPVPPRRAATALKGYLEKNYVEVKELPAGVAGVGAEVPADATAVVVADPTAALQPGVVAALTRYVETPRGGKHGKLVVLAGQQAGPDGRALRTGLEPVLQKLGAQLGDRFLYAVPDPESRYGALDNAGGARIQEVTVAPQAVEARNPVALQFQRGRALLMLDCREVSPAAAAPGGGGAQVVLMTTPGRLTWTNAEAADNPLKAWADLNEQLARLREKLEADKADSRTAIQKLREFAAPYNLSENPRPVAVFVSEGTTARAAVFGNGWFVSDEATGRAARQRATIFLELIGATLDWLRERPPMPTDVEERTYQNYTFAPTFNWTAGVYLPLVLGTLVVIGLGVGVWVIRRK